MISDNKKTEINLSLEEVNILQEMHRSERGRKHADRIKTILFLNEWFSYKETARLLLLDRWTVKKYEKKFLKKWMDKFLDDEYVAYTWRLTELQESEVEIFVSNRFIIDAKQVIEFVKTNFDIAYTKQWINNLLHRLGFVFKKSKHIPCKANKIRQQMHIINFRVFNTLMDKENEVALFIDWVHPLHNSMNSYWWIKRWTEKEIKSNTWRKRINLNWAYDIENQEVTIIESETINAQSTIQLYEKLEKKYKDKKKIYIYRDNARYYWNQLVKKYLLTSRIVEIPLPTYSPNLNPIERLWLYFKKNVLYWKYYEKFEDFQIAIMNFFECEFDEHKEALSTFITMNFRAIWF